MSQQNNIVSLHQTYGLSSAKTIAVYLHNLRSITIVRQIMPLISTSQQHRGVKLAVLEGDNSFKERVFHLQREINHRLYTMQILNRDMTEPVPSDRIQQLFQEWNTVLEWTGGSPLENYHLHSHFIEQQMKLVWYVAERANWFLLSSSDGLKEDATLAPESRDALLVQFIIHEIPELNEIIAKLRGLATKAAVLGSCDNEVSSHLQYLLKLLNQKKEKFRKLIRVLQTYALRDVPSLIDLQIQDVKIVQLAQLIRDGILDQEHVTVDGHILFSMATAIIDSHSEVIRQGIDFIQNEVHRRHG